MEREWAAVERRSAAASGYGWTTERRRRYANDLGSDVTLVGVSARSRRQ
ncbi:hypothetical protein [Streptomyces antarcticus]|nr:MULTISPECIES: hypothetical protein [unclassified Streptomyces]MCY0944761.1 hypothetical protein [Streptomyces sp. H34-AA3]MCY0954891.1 hypothetical protein [Streptomyces sp. H27-S2]MCZ4081205.1 hypothetical protein [Streptomyces sp. H34-S5]